MLKKLRSKKVAFFGKQISATLLAMLALATLASAGLLSYYGMVTGTTTVSQSVLLDGVDYLAPHVYSYTGTGGKTITDGNHWLTNNADTLAAIKFETSYTPTPTEEEYGITTTYHMASSSVVTAVANRLVALRSLTDDGWDWIVTGLTEHSGSASSTNLYGVTALGLLEAYKLTGAYMTDATEVANHITAFEIEHGSFYRGNQYVVGFDFMYLMEYAEVKDDTTYSDFAISTWNHQKENQRVVGGHLVDFGTPQEIYDALDAYRYPGMLGAVVWHSAEYGLAAQKMGDTVFAQGMASLIASEYLSIVSEDDTKVVGWSKALELLSTIDSGTYTTEIADLITKLDGVQETDGSFGEYPIQDTAYAVIGLDAAGKLDMAQEGVKYLLSTQETNGGWLEPGDIEYAEVDSEVLQAIPISITQVTLQPEETKNFYIQNEFAISLEAAGYTIETSVVPV